MQSSVFYYENINKKYTPQYLAAIDGIRCIAVISVFLFHIDRNILPGGFVGVDVFFVISGFLITRLLLSRESDKDFFTRFYQRRIARIAPAMITVIIFTIIANYFILSKHEFALLGGDVVAAITSTINIKLVSKGNYFNLPSDTQPLLHYWSLSVEEQFYLFFPAILMCMLRMFKSLVVPVSTLLLLSFAGCWAWTAYDATFAFYMLPTRAWELLGGSLLAILEYREFSLARAAAAWAGAVGMCLLCLSIALVTDGGRFPGWLATFPVASSMLLVASAHSSNWVSKGLAHPLAVFVGKRSYSLYLWHWPIFAVVDYEWYTETAVWRNIAKILISIVLTILTYHCIENPLRRFLTVKGNRWVAFAGFFVVSALIAGIGYEMHSRFYYNPSPEQITTGGITVNSRGRGSVALVGDSLASTFGDALASLAWSGNFRLDVLSMAGHDELLGEGGDWPKVQQYLKQHRPDVIVVCELWSWKFGGDTKKLTQALSALANLADHVILLLQPPYAPEAASREGLRNGAKPPFFEESQDFEARSTGNRSLLAAAPPGMEIIDVAKVLLDADGAVRVFSPRGRLNYEDKQHLSDAGVEFVRPLLERAIKNALPVHEAADKPASL